MGEDLIYQIRKLPIYALLTVLTAVVSMSIIMLAFPSFVGTLLSWATFAVIWGSASLILVLVFYKSTRLVTGHIQGVRISDLSRAVFWLSVISSNASFSMGGINYWKNVDNVVNKIGEEYKATWQTIVSQYKMPSTKRLYGAVALAMFGILGMFSTFVIFEEFKIYAVGAMFAVLLIVIYVTGDQLKTVKLLADDPQVNQFARSLNQTIIDWTTERTTHPIRVMLAGEAFGAEPVDSLYGYLVAEIRPKSTKLQPPEVEQPRSPEIEEDLEKRVGRSIAMRKAAYISAHAIIGLITGFLVFVSLKSLFSGKVDASYFLVAALSIGFFALGQYIVYFLGPEFKVMFQGGKATPSDLQTIISRTFKSGLQSKYVSDADFRQKVDFMLMFSRQKSVELSSLKEPVKLWLQEDAKLPEKYRYFRTEANTVTLTSQGELLAETVKKKAVNIDKLLRQFEELQDKARSFRHV